MQPRLSNLRYEAGVLGIPYRRLLFELRERGALQRDPNGRGHTIRRGWEDRFRARLRPITIACDDGTSFNRVVSVVYCTRAGCNYLRSLTTQGPGSER